MPLLSADLACRDAVELATDYLEGALSWRQRRSYERHLRSCPNCSAHLAQIRAMIAALGKVEPEALPPVRAGGPHGRVPAVPPRARGSRGPGPTGRLSGGGCTRHRVGRGTHRPRTNRYVALLRGVNVGGRSVPMVELRELFRGLGHTDVTTYIQSGNVLFATPRDDAAAIGR